MIEFFKAVMAAGLPLLAAGWAVGVPRLLRVQIYTEQYLAAMLGLTLAVAFLHVRLDGRKGPRPPLFDVVLALLSLVSAGWVALFYPVISLELAYDPRSGMVLASILLLLVIEALRRVAGPPLAIIAVVFLLYGFFGAHAPGQFAALEITPERLVTQIALDTNGVLGTPLLIASTIVVVFVFFGRLLNQFGGAQFFTDIAMSLMGRYRGGAAKISIVASSLFGSISGSAVSNVMTTGVVTIPLMRRAGFKASTAAGIEAVASTGGQLMPPIMGASAFLMAEFLEIPYSEVVIAALVPAGIYYYSLFLQTDLRAAKEGIAAVADEEIPAFAPTFASGWLLLLPFVALIAALFWLNFEPDMAGLVATLLLLVLAVTIRRHGRRAGVLDILKALQGAGIAAVDIIVITAAAGIIIGVLNETGLSFGLTLFLTQLAGKNVAALLVVAALISIVLGMGMPTIGVYVLLAALVVPSLTELAITPISAHLFVLYFGMMSMITPPVAIAAYAAASLGDTDPLRTSFEAMKFGWPAYVVPFVFVLSPALILDGSALEIASALLGALLGVTLISAAIVGYFLRDLSWPVRAAGFVVGLIVIGTSST